MNRENYHTDNPLGGTLEVQTFPRRKKKNGKGWVVGLIILLALAAAFIVYCIRQPEESAFSSVTGSPPDMSLAPITPSFTPETFNTLEQTSNGISASNAGSPTQAAAKDLQNKETTNPLALEMDALDVAWHAAVANLNASDNSETVRERLMPLEVAHADIWQYVDQLMALKEHDGAWLDLSGQVDGSVEPVPDEPGEYAFALNVIELGRVIQVRGRVDTDRHALYFLVKTDAGKTLRFVESVRTKNGYFTQLLSSDGPYRGVLYFQFQDDSSVRCAIMSDEHYVSPDIIYKSPPADWDSFISKARILFTQPAP